MPEKIKSLIVNRLVYFATGENTTCRDLIANKKINYYLLQT